jgi:NitT/TauT family transport system substrate-binding protein
MARFTTLLAAAALAVTTAACGGGGVTPPVPAPEQDPAKPARARVTLTLNWYPYGEHAPFYYGLEKGIFASAGIDLVIRPGAGSGNTLQQVAQRKTDFAWADTTPLLKAITAGMKIKSVGVYLQKGPSSIEFFADKRITKPADLRGKAIGGTPGDSLYSTFPAWLEANGVSRDDVKVVNLDPPDKIPALIDGRVDAIMGFFHDQAPTIENKSGKKVDYLPYADWGMNLLGTGLVVNEATLDQDPALVRRFVAATQQAWTAAAQDIPGAVAAMAVHVGQAPPQKVIVKQFTLALSLLGPNGGRSPGVNAEATWAETIGLLAKSGDIKKPGPPSRYWDPSYATAR